jgi:DNA (cytosine-5)-methyltransferase 1
MNELALFAGAGGGILGGHLLGWRTVCAVEWEAYPASVLCARQNDGLLESFPIWDDVQTFDGKPWRGIVDVVSGGFPCQDISAAGAGAGIDGERSGMWSHMARIIGEVRPQYAFIENSPMLTIRGLERILADLAQMGFDAEWGVLGAAHIGALHLRERIWILASDNSTKRIQRVSKKKIHRQPTISWSKNVRGIEDLRNRPDIPEPLICRKNNGIPDYVDRIKAIGNAQVPIVAATAWKLLIERLENGRN